MSDWSGKWFRDPKPQPPGDGPPGIGGEPTVSLPARGAGAAAPGIGPKIGVQVASLLAFVRTVPGSAPGPEFAQETEGPVAGSTATSIFGPSPVPLGSQLTQRPSHGAKYRAPA